MIRDALPGLDPITAQYHLKVEDYAAILSKLKPAFYSPSEIKRIYSGLFLSERGCDPELTLFRCPTHALYLPATTI